MTILTGISLQHASLLLGCQEWDDLPPRNHAANADQPVVCASVLFSDLQPKQAIRVCRKTGSVRHVVNQRSILPGIAIRSFGL
jgi:hypothetical protein